MPNSITIFFSLVNLDHLTTHHQELFNIWSLLSSELRRIFPKLFFWSQRLWAHWNLIMLCAKKEIFFFYLVTIIVCTLNCCVLVFYEVSLYSSVTPIRCLVFPEFKFLHIPSLCRFLCFDYTAWRMVRDTHSQKERKLLFSYRKYFL